MTVESSERAEPPGIAISDELCQPGGGQFGRAGSCPVPKNWEASNVGNGKEVRSAKGGNRRKGSRTGPETPMLSRERSKSSGPVLWFTFVVGGFRLGP